MSFSFILGHDLLLAITFHFWFFLPSCAHDLALFLSCAMNLVGIAVLTEPDASRAPRIIGYIRCTGGRDGVTHLLATIAISHPLADSPTLRKEKSLFVFPSDRTFRTSVLREQWPRHVSPPRAAWLMTRAFTSLILRSSLHCRSDFTGSILVEMNREPR